MNDGALCAWEGSAGAFLEAAPTELLQRLTHQQRETGSPQLFAWRNSLEALREVRQACPRR